MSRPFAKPQKCAIAPNRKVKGATVNRELECLKCVLDLACKRKYIPENPASSVKHFNELRERPVRRMLTVEEEHRILAAAPPHLRVAIVLLTQTGGRTYSEGFSLRWDQVDFSSKLPSGQRRENSRLIGTRSTFRVRLRSIAGVEKGTSFEQPVSVS
jgi:hypothetical protein